MTGATTRRTSRRRGKAARIEVKVYRRLDNQDLGLSDDSPEAWELHRRRAKALHDILDNQPGLRVVNWDRTDDTERAHEWVELWLAVGNWIADPATIHAVSSSAQQVGPVPRGNGRNRGGEGVC